ncbi:MAG: enoyl-CoA hydratase/isomerase family protein [Salinivirgaceae bacterium]|nr:enoyl-CoA hydratase/isomerase family protein [Salinivirgaceae bacterium]
MNTLQLTIKNHIATITFSRPNALNALNSEVFNELNLTLDELEANKDLRVLIFTGEGKAFVAGADIAEMRDKLPAEAGVFSKIGHQTFERIENFPIPVIAAVNGFALGGGFELALACDFMIASEKAKFSAPEVNLGLIPGFNGTQRLPKIVGANNARYLLYTAEMVDANEAKQMGLVQKVVSVEELMGTVNKIAETIVGKGPQAIKSVKTTVNFGLQKGHAEGSLKEREEFAHQFGEQGKEGMNAFLEKRKANWDSFR